MTTTRDFAKSDVALEQVLRQEVGHRTWGRMREVDVRVEKNSITLRGVCSSYYVKQLAIEAVLHALECERVCLLHVDIAVDDAASPAFHAS